MVYKTELSKTDTDTTRQCRLCETVKPIEEFHLSNGGKNRRRVCKTCMHARNSALKKSSPERIEKERLRSYGYKLREYGITLDEFQTIFNQQGGVCKICSAELIIGDRLKAPHVDHCHKTGSVRGILCFMCNTGLGKFRDDPKLLESAKRYLEEEDDFYRLDSTGDATV